MHPHEFQLFLLVDFWEDFLKIPTILPFIILDCLPLKQGVGPLILTDLTPKNFLEMLCAKSGWIDLLVRGSRKCKKCTDG